MADKHLTVVELRAEGLEDDHAYSYSYWEVFSFKVFTCCKRKSERYKEYRKHKEIIEERMDIVNLIVSEGYASLLSKILMQPYQLTLASEFPTVNTVSQIEPIGITMAQAIEKLREQLADEWATQIESNINSRLMKTVQNFGLGGEKENPAAVTVSTKIEVSPTLEQSNLEKNQEPKSPELPGQTSSLKTKRLNITAPFDLFGVSPKFYIQGTSRTRTWIGCICSIFLSGTILTLFAFQLKSHVNKGESMVTSYDTHLDDHKYFDMHAGNQVLSQEWYSISGEAIKFQKYISVQYYHVTEKTKMGQKVRVPLSTTDCAEIEFLKDNLSLSNLIHCLQFKEKLEIGSNLKSGEKKYIQLDFFPCQIDCLAYPSDPDYSNVIAEILGDFVSMSKFIDSKSDLKRYQDPLSRVQSVPIYLALNSKYESIRNVVLKQTVVETNDGFIFRRRRYEKVLTYKDMVFRQKPRAEVDGIFGSINFELGNSFIMVERRYPTFVDMIAKFGGLARVIIFFIFTFMSTHHLILMDRYLLNEAILRKSKQQLESYRGQVRQQAKQDDTFFSYFEVLKFKFFYKCIKKGEKLEKYENLQKVIRDRMDAQSLISNSGNVSLLSRALLKPYQIALINQLTKTNLKFDLSTKWVGLEQAQVQLEGNQSNPKDLLARKIDHFLLKNVKQKQSDFETQECNALLSQSSRTPISLKPTLMSEQGRLDFNSEKDLRIEQHTPRVNIS